MDIRRRFEALEVSGKTRSAADLATDLPAQSAQPSNSFGHPDKGPPNRRAALQHRTHRQQQDNGSR